MRKNCSRILALLLTCVLTFAMAGPALAADTTPQAAEAAQAAVLTQTTDAASPTLFDLSDSGYLKLNKPKNKAVYYKGETIPISITIADMDDEMLFCTAMAIVNEKTEDTVWIDYTFGDGLTYKTKANTKKFPAGTYVLGAGITDVPFDEDEESMLDIDDTMVYAEFTLKTLKAPTSLKTTAGKRKVTITYKKATGATKYEIYRSTQKSKGYKKIATTTKTKYVDSKVKKGKKYYYKVRTVRTGSGTVYSAYTGAKRTGKVK